MPEFLVNLSVPFKMVVECDDEADARDWVECLPPESIIDFCCKGPRMSVVGPTLVTNVVSAKPVSRGRAGKRFVTKLKPGAKTSRA